MKAQPSPCISSLCRGLRADQNVLNLPLEAPRGPTAPGFPGSPRPRGIPLPLSRLLSNISVSLLSCRRLLDAKAGSPVPHTEAVPPAGSAFNFPCEPGEPSSVTVLSPSPAPPAGTAGAGARWSGGAERAAVSDGPCPAALRSNSPGQAAPRRGMDAGTEPSLTANPAPVLAGEQLPTGTPTLPAHRAGSALAPPARGPSPGAGQGGALWEPTPHRRGNVPRPPKDG